MNLERTSPTEIREKLKELHEEEAQSNKAMSDIDKEILLLQNKKKKLAKKISHNMTYRKKLIDNLP